MGLLKSRIRSLCLNDEQPLYDQYKSGDPMKLINEVICEKNFYLNPLYTKSEDMKAILQEIRVVCCTKEEIYTEALKNITFSRIIVDDSNQLRETSLLMPLIKNCQQLVLLGDDKQLSPNSTSLMAKSKGINLSLYDRLLRQGVKPTNLNIQYCMAPSLSAFTSMKFYSGTIENGVSPDQSPLINGFEWPNSEINCAFIHVSSESGEKFIASKNSYINNPEVDVACNLVVKMISGGELTLDEMGLITSYESQRDRMKKELLGMVEKYPNILGDNRDENQENVTNQIVQNNVVLLDECLDLEKEMVIFSAVRSNNEGEIGILKDPRRMNTVLTRARRGLIVIGDLQTLIKNEHWRDWLSWAQFSNIILKS